MLNHRRRLSRLLIMAALLGNASMAFPLAAQAADSGASEPSAVVRQSATPAPAPAQIPTAPRPAGPAASAPTPDLAARITQGVWLWQRTEYNNDTVVTVNEPSKYALAFQPDGALTVQADCNRGMGRYLLDGSRVTLTLGAMTLGLCPSGSQSDVFLRDLRDVASFVMDGEHLVLNLRVDGGNMVFAPQPAASLVGPEWRVTGVNNGRGGLASVAPDATLTATFASDGSVSGNTGCNQFRGGYTVDGAALHVGELISTRRACISDALSAQEQQYLTALRAATTYRLDGNQLTLRDASGAMQVTLIRSSDAESTP